VSQPAPAGRKPLRWWQGQRERKNMTQFRCTLCDWLVMECDASAFDLGLYDEERRGAEQAHYRSFHRGIERTEPATKVTPGQ